MKKILITGGHVTPALAVIQGLKNKFKDKINIIFVGRKYAFENEKTLSFEYKEIKKREIEFISIETGRLTRIISLKTIRSIMRIPLGFFNAYKILKRQKPDVILSFGGYIALPIALWSCIFKIPLYTHEQTIHPGLSNRIIGIFAKRIFIAFKDTQSYFDKNKVVLTGNPIRPIIFNTISKPFIIKKDKPVIYITGGSLGSHSINNKIGNIIYELLKKYIVIHQVGDSIEYKDYEKLVKLRKTFPTNLQKNYFLSKHFLEHEIGYIYSVCDIVVGRSGANTFFELISLKIPAVFIPLPWSANDEQKKHAIIFKHAGTGEIFLQKEDSKKLIQLINKVAVNIYKYIYNFRTLQYLNSENAVNKIIKEIFNNS